METAQRGSIGDTERGEAGQGGGVGALDPRAEALKRDLAGAHKVEDLAKFYLQAGMDPKYVAHLFMVSLERCQRYAEALQKQREAQRERQSARGYSEAPEIGEGDNGS